MSAKSLKVKNFVKDTGTKNQLFVFAGYNPNANISDSNEASINLWNYSDFSVKVGQNSILPVVPYVKWERSRPFRPWSSTQPNSGNFYAYNDQNGYVYLCISDNNENRTDHSGRAVTTIRPSHTSGIQKYSDGYSWKPLYKITPSIERFVTASWLPVISFEIYDATPQVNQLKLTQNFCGNLDSGRTGQCGVYAKIPLNTDDDSGTTEYEMGDLFTISNNITCSDCHYMMYNNEKFTSVFYEKTASVPTSIAIKNNYDLVGSLINENQISSASPYYHLYQINENDNINEGSVISAFIDLSGFSSSQLISNKVNPFLNVTSNTGTGAKIRLKTTIYQDSNIIAGIEVVEPGSNYKDITLSLDSGILNIDSSLIISVIDVNIDTVDGLGFDPVDILDAKHAMIDTRIEKQTIRDSSIVLPDKLNFFGVIQNPTSFVNSNNIVSGSNKNKKIDVIYRTSILVGVGNSSGPTDLPETGEIYNSTLPESVTDPSISSKTTNNILIGGLEPTQTGEGGVASFSTRAEVKNISYNKADYLVGLNIVGTSKTTNTITDVIQVPEFVQYTGKVLSSKKLNGDLNISDTDSVIIRINIIEGM